MKFLLFLLLCVTATTSSQEAEISCNIGEFKHISFTVHEPSERKQLTLLWVKKNRCNKEELTLIYNNLSAWLGTADNLEIRNLIETKYRNEK